MKKTWEISGDVTNVTRGVATVEITEARDSEGNILDGLSETRQISRNDCASGVWDEICDAYGENEGLTDVKINIDLDDLL